MHSQSDHGYPVGNTPCIACGSYQRLCCDGHGKKPTEWRVGSWAIRLTFPVPPIPSWRDHEWSYVHDDFDGAEDSNDPRCGTAASPDACLAEIEDYEGGSR